MDRPNEVVYDSGAEHRHGLSMWITMARELWGAREIVTHLIMRDISVRYRQSVLGYLWAITLPLATVIVFTFLTSRRVLPIGQPPMPYPVFALCNLIVWQLFAGVLLAATQSLASAGALVTRMSFPKEALVIAAVGQPLFDFMIKLVLVAMVFVYFGVKPDPMALFLPLLLLPLLLLAVGLGFLLSVINLAVRDVGNVVGMLTTFGMFAAPVLYPPPVTAPFYLVNIVNPFSPLLIATQDLLAYGVLRHATIFWPAVLFSILIFLVGWWAFRLVIR